MARAIRGRLVTLRPFAAGFSSAEMARMYAWARDPELLELSGGVMLDMSLAAFQSAFLSQLPRRNTASAQWFAVLTASGRLIGRAGLYDMAVEHRRAEAGIVLGDRSCWGRGYGRDALGALVDYGFRDLGLTQVTLQTFPRNVRAIRSFESLGFRVMREVARFSLDRGSHHTVEMALSRADRARALRQALRDR